MTSTKPSAHVLRNVPLPAGLKHTACSCGCGHPPQPSWPPTSTPRRAVPQPTCTTRNPSALCNNVHNALLCHSNVAHHQDRAKRPGPMHPPSAGPCIRRNPAKGHAALPLALHADACAAPASPSPALHPAARPLPLTHHPSSCGPPCRYSYPPPPARHVPLSPVAARFSIFPRSPPPGRHVPLLPPALSHSGTPATPGP